MSSARIGSERAEGAAYVDTSAFVKLVLDEPESLAMEEVFNRTPLISSALLVTELLRTVRRACPERTDHAIALLDHIATMPVSADVLMAAGFLDTPRLRSLDAIHLAAALSIGPDLAGVVTYDGRLAEAAGLLGLRVEAPGRAELGAR
jgi:predicted nucleic acid-binding protein